MLTDPFHEGERIAQAMAGFRLRGAPIRDAMPDQHRLFFESLPLLFVAVPGEDGRPLAGVVAGPPGFVASPTDRLLSLALAADADDPLLARLVPGAPVGLLGIELPTRRRNRANGVVVAAGPEGIVVEVDESFGNCPQYIQARDTVWQPRDVAAVPGEGFDGLDAAARETVAAADTLFVASGLPGTGGMDMSHRGGRPGFVRIEGDTLVVPDFRGNRYFNTLGNFVLNPWASLLFVDFSSGDVTRLDGGVSLDWTADDPAGGAERHWRLRVERGWRRRAALPLRFGPPDFAPTTLRTGPPA